MFRKKNKRKKLSTMPRMLVTLSDNYSFVSEQFRTIRTNITFSMSVQDQKTLLITSSIPGEGKTTNAANIAIVFAQEGKKVLLIDADMRKPTLHITFNILNLDGFSTVLARKKQYYEVIQNTSVEGLFIIPSGPIPPNPAELLSSKALDEILNEVKKYYDIIIFDAPPLLSVTDGQILANKADGTLLIVKSGSTEKEDVLKSKEILLASRANILGAILNNYKIPKNNYYRYQYAYIEKR